MTTAPVHTLDANKLLVLLFAAYPVETRNVPGDQALATAKIYAQALSDLVVAEVVNAIEFLIKTSERLPTVAKIRQTVLDLRYGPPRPGGDAWGDVVREIGRRGLRGDCAFADPLVAKTVQRFGWSELCRSENPTADRARFIELYDQLHAQERVIAAARPNANSDALRLAHVAQAVNDRPSWPAIGPADLRRLGGGA